MGAKLVIQMDGKKTRITNNKVSVIVVYISHLFVMNLLSIT